MKIQKSGFISPAPQSSKASLERNWVSRKDVGAEMILGYDTTV